MEGWVKNMYFWITSLVPNHEAIESQPSSFRTLYRNSHSNSSNLLTTGGGIKIYHQQPNTTHIHKHMYYWIPYLSNKIWGGTQEDMRYPDFWKLLLQVAVISPFWDRFQNFAQQYKSCYFQTSVFLLWSLCIWYGKSVLYPPHREFLRTYTHAGSEFGNKLNIWS